MASFCRLYFLTLNRFQMLFWCFHCWFWTSKCEVGNNLEGNMIHVQALQKCFSLVTRRCVLIIEKRDLHRWLCSVALIIHFKHDMHFDISFSSWVWASNCLLDMDGKEVSLWYYHHPHNFDFWVFPRCWGKIKWIVKVTHKIPNVDYYNKKADRKITKKFSKFHFQVSWWKYINKWNIETFTFKPDSEYTFFRNRRCFLLFVSLPYVNVRKPLVFWCFQGV